MVYFCGRITFVVFKIVSHFRVVLRLWKSLSYVCGVFTIVEKSVYVCERFTFMDGFAFGYTCKPHITWPFTTLSNSLNCRFQLHVTTINDPTNIPVIAHHCYLRLFIEEIALKSLYYSRVRWPAIVLSLSPC